MNRHERRRLKMSKLPALPSEGIVLLPDKDGGGVQYLIQDEATAARIAVQAFEAGMSMDEYVRTTMAEAMADARKVEP
jgi:hypothetical protein